MDDREGHRKWVLMDLLRHGVSEKVARVPTGGQWSYSQLKPPIFVRRVVSHTRAHTHAHVHTHTHVHTHAHTHTHVHTQCAFTVCYSVTAVTLGIFSSCSLCCQTHTPWSSKTGLYRLQPVADCKADLLSVVMLLPHDFIFFLLES